MTITEGDVGVTQLEGAPSDAQKRRLEDYLAELKIICRQYRFLLDTDDADVRIIDLDRNTIVGIGLTYLLSERGGRARITGYDISDSILDGVWPVDGPPGTSGPVEQRTVQPVWPRHPSED